MTAAQVLVVAKEPVPGKAKTRLTPPLSPEQAATVARAALEDTLEAVRRTEVDARVLVLDGCFPADGFRLQPQVAGPLDERLAAALEQAWAALPLPLLLVGMDTPQLTEVLLEKALATLLSPGVDAVLGLAEDGGWWAIGLRHGHGDLVRGVPTSRADTGAAQHARLVAAGLRVADLPVLRDVDTVEDLGPVSRLAQDGRFAAAVAEVLP